MARDLRRSYDVGTPTPRRLDTLTALRFPAAAMIVACHAGTLIVVFPPLWRLQMGVTVFFVLSGFVLTWGNAGMDVRTFYLRRAARIIPLYLLAVGFGLVVNLIKGFHSGALITVTTFTFTQAWIPNASLISAPIDQPTWSLSCEVFFYLVFPAIHPVMHRLRRSHRRILLFGCIGFTMLYFLVLLPLPVARELYWFPLTRLPEFVAGMLLCMEVRDGLRVPWWAAITAMAVTVPAAISPPSFIAETGVGIIAAVLVIGAAASNDLAARWQPPKLLVDLGIWSYALYLLHLPLMQLVGSGNWEGALLVSLLTVPLSALVYRLVEEPFERSLRIRIARLSQADRAVA